MTTPHEARARAERTYDAAADAYDLPANSYWERFGRRTVERLELAGGARVLDVCCGSGASALAAAEIVGPRGAVLGVDLSQNLLGLAREKAQRQGLCNAQFRAGDMLALEAEREAWDAVVCVFGIFFVPDMPFAVRELWARVRPGGRLAITTWGPRVFEPANTLFWEAVRALRPELHRAFAPWDLVVEPAALRAVLEQGGVTAVEIEPESGVHELGSAEDWWSVVLGSGYRGTLEQLAPEHRERVRESTTEALRRSGVLALETNVLYAVARKAP